MKTRIILILTVAFAVLGGVYAFKAMQTRKAMAGMASMAPPPPSVSTAPAVAESWRDTLSSVATLQSSQSILVSTEFSGIVHRIAFASGAEVKAGDLLLELDSSTEQAQLEGLEAAARLSVLSLGRATELRAKGTNSQSDLDDALASNQQAVASVNQLKAVIAKKRITAPFPGRLGIRMVSLGEYLGAGAPIVMLESPAPIYADFGIPQNDLSRLQAGQPVTLRIDAYPGRDFTGVIEAINPRVNDTTRNVTVRAVFPNADLALRGGMFGTVFLDTGEPAPIQVLPATAIVFSTYGNFVYVVDKTPAGGLIARQQFVTTGEKRGDQVAILKGLKAGDQVVTSGQLKLRNGMPVVVNNRVQPDNSPAPKPQES
jgi:membrane fusion protein (multidrug efflux system)